MKVKDETLLALCLTGHTQAQIATELGMTKAQICHRVNKPAFQEILSAYRKQVIDGILTDLTANAQKSVYTLVQLLDDPNPFIRLQAACKILSLTQDYSVHKDLLNDVAEWKASQQEELYEQ